MIPPVGRVEQDPGADNSQPRPRGQESPKRGRPSRGTRLRAHHGREGRGGRASPTYTSSNVAGDLGDLNGERGRRAPRPDEERNPTTRSRRRGRERRSRGKKPPTEQEESGTFYPVEWWRGNLTKMYNDREGLSKNYRPMVM